jgi:hypothetical protein
MEIESTPKFFIFKRNLSADSPEFIYGMEEIQKVIIRKKYVN